MRSALLAELPFPSGDLMFVCGSLGISLHSQWFATIICHGMDLYLSFQFTEYTSDLKIAILNHSGYDFIQLHSCSSHLSHMKLLWNNIKGSPSGLQLSQLLFYIFIFLCKNFVSYYSVWSNVVTTSNHQFLFEYV